MSTFPAPQAHVIINIKNHNIQLVFLKKVNLWLIQWQKKQLDAHHPVAQPEQNIFNISTAPQAHLIINSTNRNIQLLSIAYL